jgi:hypothetical protein
MKRQQERKEEEQRIPQKKLEEAPKNVTNVGPVTVRVSPDAAVLESPPKNEE